jgi:hypothetical protein
MALPLQPTQYELTRSSKLGNSHENFWQPLQVELEIFV